MEWAVGLDIPGIRPKRSGRRSLADAGEIDTAYHATNAGTHYFRMNLVGPTLSNSYASLYAIYIDLTPDGDRSSWITDWS